MHVCTLVGARPQFIKAAAVSPALTKAGINETLIHSGQHYDKLLSQIFFDELGVPAPAANLEAGSGSHAAQTGDIMVKFEGFIRDTGPYDAVIVYGDTNTTLAGALVAAKENIPLAHVEAGLRSFNWLMPEEINRILTDRVSKWLFAPTKTAFENLNREGLERQSLLVGDVMLDATNMFSERAKNQCPLKSITLHNPKEYILATVHRPSNTDIQKNLQNIFDAFRQLPLPIILPIHPRTQKALDYVDDVPDNVEIISPVSYLTMLTLILNAYRVLTDSGGIQKEAYWLETPSIILRDETEYSEICENNWSLCTGENHKLIVHAVNKKPTGPQSRFGEGPDGYASEMIARSLAQ